MKGIHKTATGFRAFVRVHPGKGGLRSRRYDKTATVTEMKAWREAERVKHREQPKVRAARGTLGADIDHYLKLVATMPTITDRTRDLEAWRAVFGMRPRHKLTRDDYRLILQDWRLHGKAGGKPLAASTVNHRRTAMEHLYTVLDGKGAPNPLREIHPFAEPPAEPRDLGLDVARAIIAAMRKSKTRARIKVLAWTGMRGNSELGKMKPEYVNLEARECWAPTGKKGKPRLIVLNEEGVEAWQEFIALKAWGRYQKDSLRHSFQLAVKKVNEARAEAKLPPLHHVRVYDLRHTIATALRRAGADLADIQAHLGHTSPRMTQRYAPFQSDKLRQTLTRLR